LPRRCITGGFEPGGRSKASHARTRIRSNSQAAGGDAFQRNLPTAEIHPLDAGHFALDEKVDEIASLILRFLGGASGLSAIHAPDPR
jgi:hypothetical protein